jgi:hypothetical protein
VIRILTDRAEVPNKKYISFTPFVEGLRMNITSQIDKIKKITIKIKSNFGPLDFPPAQEH